MMLCRDDRVDPAAHVKIPDHRHAPRMTGCDQGVQNAIDDVLVEGALFSERPKVELQGFKLDAELIRNIENPDRRKVRLAGARANAGKLGTLHADLVVPLRSGIGKGFKLFAWVGWHTLILTEQGVISK